MEFSIRKATINDVLNLKSLEKKCFDEHIRENFEFVLNSKNYIIYVCEKKDLDKNDIVGYAGASISYEQGDILSVCVHSDFRKRSVAYVLMDTLLEELKNLGVESVFLEVEEDNFPAIKLYQKLNFIKISERKNYYGNKTAIIMQKKL